MRSERLKLKWMKIAIAGVVAILMLLPATYAFAVTNTTSNTVTKSYDGYTYQCYGSTRNNNGAGRGLTTTKCTSGQRPAGYLCAFVCLHSSSGVASTNVSYNTNANTFTQAITNMSGYSSYYVTGSGSVWRPALNDYYSIGDIKTPMAAKSRSAGIEMKTEISYAVNEEGMTYGNMLAAEANGGRLPDLIEANGLSGHDGYILLDDMEECLADNPSEALELMKMGSTTIPVYEVDGKTIVDEYLVTYGSQE